MHTVTLNFLRLATFVHRVLLLLASVFIFGTFTYFLVTRADHEMGSSKWVSAVEGISGAALCYSLVLAILTLPYGGHPTVATVSMILDVLFIPAFVAIAILNRHCTGSCEGNVDTALGKGSGRSQPVGFGKEGFGTKKGKEENVTYMVRYSAACKLQKGAFYTSIISIVLLLGTLFCHYYYTRTFATARREGLPSTRNRRAFGLWPFGHSAADEEKAFQERVKSYTAKGFSNRPDDVPVERPVQGGQRYDQRQHGQYRGNDGSDTSSYGGKPTTGGKMKHFFSKMMPGHTADSSDRGGSESDQEPLQARYQYPHHDMQGDKYLNEGNAAPTTDSASTRSGGQQPDDGDDGDGYHNVNLDNQPDSDEKSMYTDARTNLSPPTSWADRKRAELKSQREQRAQQIPGGNLERARQPSAVDYANGTASPRQEAAQRYAREREYAKDGAIDPRSTASHIKRETKRGAHEAARQDQQQAHGQDPGDLTRNIQQAGAERQKERNQQTGDSHGRKQRGNGHGKVHPEGTGRQGQQQAEAVVDGPRKAGPGAGALRDTPYGPKGQAPGVGGPAGGIDSRTAKHAYGY
ncbi:hypothetical protein KEM56_006881 [Ascosphaera pollenicola]|nr:hypothetical protein KEM56_006881 [Ascosphaera pollenicola]